jgi:hypothetical protein
VAEGVAPAPAVTVSGAPLKKMMAGKDGVGVFAAQTGRELSVGAGDRYAEGWKAIYWALWG